MKTFFKVPTIMIHDPSLKIVGVIDNNKPKSLHFFDDEWERDLATGASVFSFSVYKKFTSDNELQRDPSSLLRKRNFISFNYKGETFLFLIYKIKETRTMLELECRNLNLELINESALPFKSDQPLTFKQYAEKMDLLNFTKLSIGINEVTSYTRTLEFSSSETKLARLLDLLSKFNAEHEFKTVLNPDGTLKEFKLNVYKEYDGENFGVGKKQKNMILLGERFLTDITRTVDYGGLFTMLVPTSTKSVVDEASKSDEHGQKVTTVTNPDGSTTRTTVWTNSDGSQSKSVITTKVTKNADGSTTTVKRTEKANGSVIETTTVRTSKGNANSTTKVLKPPTSNKDTGEKELIDIASLPDWEVKNSDGEIEFYKKGEALYAPIASKLYPSTFTAEAQSDLWIRKDSSYDAGSSEILEQMAFKDLKLHAYPSISYEIEGWTDLDIGDRVPIQDNEFSPILIIEARVSKQKLSFTKPENSRTTYDNFKSLSSNLSADIQSRLAELVEDAKPYTIQVSSDNGTTFKNGVGESVVKAKLYKGNTLTTSDVSWRWLFNDDAKISAQYTVKASDIKETSVLTVIAYVGDNEVATAEVTFTNVGDGVGVESIDRYYTTNNKSENVTVDSEEWSDEQTEMTADKKYAWSYDVITYSDGTTKVTKPVIIGIRGDDGLDADALGITDSLNETKKELSGLAANIDKLKADTLVAGDEAKKQIETVSNDLSKAKMDLQNAVSAVDTKATNLQSDLTTAKQDLTNQAQQLQAQASAQSELTKRVSSVEKNANGTKTTVSELSKTIDSNTKNISSVTARTKTVEDDLTSTKTTLSQVQTTANSASQKTATLETGLNGLSARFSSLRVGGHNYLRGTSDQYQTLTSNNYILGYTGNKNISFLDLLEPLKGETVTIRSYIKNDTDFPVRIQIWFTGGGINGNPVPAHEEGYSVATGKILENFASCNVAFVQVGDGTKNGGTIQHKEDKLEKGNIATDYSPNEADIESKVAEYKQTADQNYASLQSNLQTLDGTVKSNKATADQTAEGFKTRIESFETYKDGESTRAKSYFEASKSETAKQLTAERIAIAKDYVAKSTYTSDVTGIKNDLSTIKTTADTTKTNLANYQASNDKAVANLQSNLQTANGNISSLQTKVEAVPGQITSAVSAVEGKIPTEIGSSNLLRNTAVNADNLKIFGTSNSTISIVTKDGHQTYKIVVSATNNSGVVFNGNAQYYNLIKDRSYTFSFWVLTNKDKSYSFESLGHIQVCNGNGDQVGNDIAHQHTTPVYSTNTIKANTWTKVWCTFKATSNSYFKPYFWYLKTGDEIYIYDMMLNEGKIPLSYTPAVEDTQSDITKLNTTLTQTANGLKQLSTQVTSQGSTITSHTNSINSLTTGLSAKVSQTDFNTLSGRVTTAENNIIAKANELSSKITSVEEKIPTSVGGRNLVRGTANFSSGWAWNTKVATITDIIDKFNVYHGTSTGTDTALNTYDVRFDNALTVLPDTEYTLSFWVKGSGTIYSHFFPSCVAYGINSDGKTTTAADGFITHTLKSNWERYWITWKTLPTANGLKNVLPCRQVSTAKSEVWLYGVKLEKGKIPTDWTPAPEDYDSKLATAQSEIKQTTDSIKASVSALDKSTVKSASLTINTDGIVMKAGKSTTDVANAIGSYFAVNQNAINLFSDKINVKANMIVNGAITSDKIAAGAINADKISASGITADKIKGGMLQSKTNTTKFDLDSGKLFYNSNNTGIFRIQNNASTMGLKFSNTNITVNGSSHILSRVILGGDRRETTLDDGKWDQGGFSGIVVETINGIAANEHDKADTVRVVADNIYFTHSYNKDVATNTSAAGWKMETFSPNSTYTGHIVMKPFGINYRYADIVTGDVRLDNGDGSGYWVRGCIQVLRNCFQHFLNGGTSNDAKNAIRNALKDISGV